MGIGIKDYAVGMRNYITTTPVKQQLSDTLRDLSNPDLWSRTLATTAEMLVSAKVSGGTGRTTTVSAAKETIKATGDNLKSLYRAVGPDEFYDIMKSGEFRVIPNGLQAKQFGLKFEETLKFADKYSDIGAVIEVKVPTEMLKKLGILHKLTSLSLKVAL